MFLLPLLVFYSIMCMKKATFIAVSLFNKNNDAASERKLLLNSCLSSIDCCIDDFLRNFNRIEMIKVCV